MDQGTFSKAEKQTKKRKTRPEIFLERVDKLITSKQLEKEGSGLLSQRPDWTAAVPAVYHAARSRFSSLPA